MNGKKEEGRQSGYEDLKGICIKETEERGEVKTEKKRRRQEIQETKKRKWKNSLEERN